MGYGSSQGMLKHKALRPRCTEFSGWNKRSVKDGGVFFFLPDYCRLDTYLNIDACVGGLSNKNPDKLLIWFLFEVTFAFFGTCSFTKGVLNQVKLGVSLRVPYCEVDAGYGLGISLGDCRPALPKGQKYQMVKTQTLSR